MWITLQTKNNKSWQFNSKHDLLAIEPAPTTLWSLCFRKILFKAIGPFRYRQMKVHRFTNNLQGLQKVVVKDFSWNMFWNALLFEKTLKTIPILVSENYGFILNTCHDTAKRADTRVGFPVVFSRLRWPIEPNFSQVCYLIYKFWYTKCGPWKILFTERVQWLHRFKTEFTWGDMSNSNTQTLLRTWFYSFRTFLWWSISIICFHLSNCLERYFHLKYCDVQGNGWFLILVPVPWRWLKPARRNVETNLRTSLRGSALITIWAKVVEYRKTVL